MENFLGCDSGGLLCAMRMHAAAIKFQFPNTARPNLVCGIIPDEEPVFSTNSSGCRARRDRAFSLLCPPTNPELITFLLFLFAGEPSFFSIDDNDKSPVST